MNSKQKLKPGALYMFASFFNKGIAFLTLPIFTRLLSTGEYGTVSTYSSWVAIVSIVSGMSLNIAIRLSRGKDFKLKITKDEELASIFTVTLLVGGILFAVCMIFNTLINTTISELLIVLCFLEGIFGWLITDYTYYQMMESKYLGRTLLMILPNLLAAVFSVILILNLQGDKSWGRIIPIAVCPTVVGLFLCFRVFFKHRPCLNKKYLKWALKVSLPLIVHALALNILLQSDRIMITAFRNTSETGVYSLIYSFSTLAIVLTSGLEGIWTPFFTKKMNEEDYDNVNVFSKDYINLISYAMVGIIMISPELMKLMSTSDYYEGIIVLPLLVLADFFAFAYTFYVDVEYYYEKTKFITVNTVIAASLNIVLNYILIPQYGYFAAAFTTLVSYIVSFTLHYMYAKKLNTALFNIKSFVRPLVILSVFTVVFYLLMDNFIYRWGILFCFLVMMLFREKNRIKLYL